MAGLLPYRAVLFDLEGTLYDAAGPIAGAAEAVSAVRSAGLQVRFLTNATRRSREGLVTKLRGMSIEADPDELFTAVTAAATWCRAQARSNVLALLEPATLVDLEGLRIRSVFAGPERRRAAAEDVASEKGGERPAPPRAVTVADLGEAELPEAVIVGDLGEAWSYGILNQAFRCLQAGAVLVACQRNRYWQTADGLSLDAGPFVAALEFAAGTEAVVVGKPSAAFFKAALERDGVAPREALVIGDDAEVDAGGAIGAGLAGWVVRTGKYRPGDESRVSPWPECVLDSVADLPAALGI